ncbi:hypothetical protein FA95DRAFT_925924 [Auriscalpium vulgare]|uniref:Uncharacterized protein n=1 Tax=Auriscalpium vulgare TaxID=40419 RepID=A0ACB8R7U8_9AGAM|nr:hypothetical protein FA95DRAFT_925924 [Auriscalpium vulgare]
MLPSMYLSCSLLRQRKLPTRQRLPSPPSPRVRRRIILFPGLLLTPTRQITSPPSPLLRPAPPPTFPLACPFPLVLDAPHRHVRSPHPSRPHLSLRPPQRASKQLLLPPRRTRRLCSTSARNCTQARIPSIQALRLQSQYCLAIVSPKSGRSMPVLRMVATVLTSWRMSPLCPRVSRNPPLRSPIARCRPLPSRDLSRPTSLRSTCTHLP